MDNLLKLELLRTFVLLVLLGFSIVSGFFAISSFDSKSPKPIKKKKIILWFGCAVLSSLVFIIIQGWGMAFTPKSSQTVISKPSDRFTDEIPFSEVSPPVKSWSDVVASNRAENAASRERFLKLPEK